jgi:hypothetical protein
MDCGLSGTIDGAALSTWRQVLGPKVLCILIKYFINTMGTQNSSIHFQSFPSVESVPNS